MNPGPAIDEEPRLRYQRMALLGLTLICGTLTCVTAITHNYLATAIFAVACAAMVAGRAVVSSRPRATRWVAHGAAALIYAAATYLAVFRGGGLSAPALFALPTIPMSMAFVAGRRAAYFWGFMTAIPPVALALLAEHLPPAAIEGVALQAMRLCGPLGATAAVLVAAIAYEDSVRRSTDALVEARRLADEARRAAERANSAKSGYLANLSHELRTPLGAIVGLSELIQQHPAGEDVPRQAELLHSSARSLLGLIDDVLDLSRIEAGGLRLESAPVALGAILREVAESMRHRAIAKGIDLHVEIEAQGAVSGDALRIRQIASNLIGNAIKFTAAGHVAVHLHVGPVEDDGQRAIQLSVADTGPGVTPQQQALIFQRFQQATEGTARQFGGSGLGLAIVKELVEHMHGELSLQSQFGGGSTFAVRLRLPATTLQPSAAPPTAGPGVGRVMLVEDDRTNREVLRALLVRLSCEVTVAEDGEEAVARWAAAAPVQRPQLIFMDCQMPGLDGFDATRQLRALGCATPIVALTASALPEDRAACLEAGMDAVLTKPTTLAALRDALQRPAAPSG